MNISNNRRYQETEQRIQSAFLKLLESGKDIDEIYIQDICRAGNITRPTFYSHYEDINDLVMQIEMEKAERIRSIMTAYAVPTQRSLEQYFEYLQDNRIFYLAFFRAGDRSYISRPLMESYLEEYADTSRHESIQYQMDFFAAGLKAVAFRWLKSGCVQSPTEMAMLVMMYENRSGLFSKTGNCDAL